MKSCVSTIRVLWPYVLCVLACAVPWGSAVRAQTTHYVDNLGNCAGQVPCHGTIVEAVGAAVPYDTIEVFPGVYHESVLFAPGKDHIALVARPSLLMPVIAAPPAPGSTSVAVWLKASNVQVRNFVLEAPQGYGVLHDGLAGSTNAVISGNRISGLYRGIFMGPCHSSYLTNNWVLSGGVDMFSSAGCVISGNTVEGASIGVGDGDLPVSDTKVLRNTVRGGSILAVAANPLLGNTVAMNQVESGDIRVSATCNGDGNAIRLNVVRGGGIALGTARFGCDLGANTIADNVVSGGPADGIALTAVGGQVTVTRNTSVESAACDIDDNAGSGFPQNTWTDNRFGTKCGAATQ